MTQSLNLSQFANNVDSAGKLNAAQGLGNTVPVLNGGTGQSSFANGELLIGNSNGNTLTKAKLTAGTNVTITEGPGSITIAAAGGGGGGGGTGDPVSGELGYALYTSGSGTWTCPPGVTKVKVTVIGGGGGGYAASGETQYYGGPGGVAIGIYTVTPGTGYAYTVGAGGSGTLTTGVANPGNSSSFGSFCSATGGGAGNSPSGYAGSSGSGSGGTISNSYVMPSPIISATAAYGSYFAHIFMGQANFNPDPLQKFPVAWATSSILCPGAPGAAQGNLAGSGGVGGVVYIEYVEVTGTATAEGSNLDYALYTSGSGTWTCPSGVTKVKVTCIAGGGGGVYIDDINDLYGGYGGCAVGIYTVTPGVGYAYSVGSGGNGGDGDLIQPTSGTSSSVTGLCSATGGQVPSGGNGVSGVGSNGNITNSVYSGQYMFHGAKAPGIPGVAWTPTLQPGRGGRGYNGGVGGLILIEYIRGVSIGGTGSIGDHALFTSGSGTWTCPSGVTKVKVTCIGGGGVAGSILIGLPFGGLAIGVYTVTPGTGYAYTVGAGGTAFVTNEGGNSSLAGLCSATGGGYAPGYNVPGVGSGGTFTNSSVASFEFVGTYPAVYASAIPPFAGSCARRLGGPNPIVWTPTSGLIPGAAGGEWNPGNNQWQPLGGVGGAILIEYIG